MSHTSDLQPELFYAPCPSSLRTFITTEEYEKQGKEFTKQELKQASLYYQHSFHFIVLSATQRLRFLWTKKSLLFVVIALLVCCVAVALQGESAPASEGMYLVPATSFTQKVINLPYEFLDRIRQFAGQTNKVLLVPPEDGVFGSVNENQTFSSQLGNSNKGITREKTGKETPEREVGETAALVDSTSFSTFVQSQTTKGMDIFSFAFCVARDFASSLFAKAFGWTENGTAPASAPPA